MANNVNVPKVQTSDRVITQLQQNIITGMNDMNSTLATATNAFQAALDASTIIGEEKAAYLTEAQFQAVAGPTWVLQDGRSCIGSAYASLTGQATVPDMRGRTGISAGTGPGLTARALFDIGGEETHLLTVPEMPSHGHVNNWGDGVSGGTPNHSYIPSIAIGWSATGDPGTYGATMIQPTGGSTPHNNMQPFVVKNYFIRIN